MLASNSAISDPNLNHLYTAQEQEDRDLLLAWLALTPPSEESKQPLHQFLSTDAIERVRQIDGEEALDGICDTTTDEEVAATHGLTARDVHEARLSRTALEAALDCIADFVIDDYQSEEWDSHILSDIYPYSGRTLDMADLAQRTRQATLAVRQRFNAGHPYPANSTAEEMILWCAVESHLDHLMAAGVDEPFCPLHEILFEDNDFRMLFDPAMDGIESTPVAEFMGMTITGPEGWFNPFRREETGSEFPASGTDAVAR